MTRPSKDSRRDLRERAFQALFSLEFGGDFLAASQFAYAYDKDDEGELDVPVFLLNLVQGVMANRDALDEAIEGKLKTKWSLSRLTLTDKTLLRLGLYEILYVADTPNPVVLNEVIEIAKTYSDTTSSKFVNGLLRQFVADEPAGQ